MGYIMAGQKNVVLLFHIYQPPWQTVEAFEAEYQNSYLPLLKIIKDQNIKVTLNIAGSLVEFLQRQHKTAFRDLLQELLAAKLIELTGSAMYHALLPLTPADEVARQIQLNTEALKNYLGNDLKLAGFYIPELAADTATLRHIKQAGFSWATVDESSLLKPDWEKAMIDDDSGITVLANDSAFRTSGAAKFERPNN
ncbi:MAG TPA: polysaccharide deacetylase family protein, partial [Candidatus Acidoferrum sp.]|nr:polysaccharide deacetylase family protein [Candidatus Acidoferrum sp.]